MNFHHQIAPKVGNGFQVAAFNLAAIDLMSWLRYVPPTIEIHTICSKQIFPFSWSAWRWETTDIWILTNDESKTLTKLIYFAFFHSAMKNRMRLSQMIYAGHRHRSQLLSKSTDGDYSAEIRPNSYEFPITDAWIFQLGLWPSTVYNFYLPDCTTGSQ